MEKKITVGSVCFLLDKAHGKVLLLHRKNEPMQHQSTGVGGKTGFLEDIRLSCHREVLEETGLVPENVRLKGVLKTVAEGGCSSWILFAYTAESDSQELKGCDEGTLEWVSLQDLQSHRIIGFIQRILPYILDGSSFFEGTVIHDQKGQVIADEITVYSV